MGMMVTECSRRSILSRSRAATSTHERERRLLSDQGEVDVPDDRDRNSTTSDYSGTKAPENQEHVQSEFQSDDPELKPGGRRGAKVPVGMPELDRDTVPNRATDTGQTRYGERPQSDRHGSDRD
jgi:hypothetical protein